MRRSLFVIAVWKRNRQRGRERPPTVRSSADAVYQSNFPDSGFLSILMNPPTVRTWVWASASLLKACGYQDSEMRVDENMTFQIKASSIADSGDRGSSSGASGRGIEASSWFSELMFGLSAWGRCTGTFSVEVVPSQASSKHRVPRVLL